MAGTPYTDRANILLVDDHPNIVASLKKLLSDEYNVFTALEGRSALSIMEQHDIALVLADYRMPGMSGTELLESVRHMYPDVMRIIFSGHFDQEVLMKAINEVQVHEVLPKPCRNEELRFTVARWIEQYRKMKRLEEKANQYDVVQNQLEEANKLIQELMQELKEVNASESDRTSFWQRRRKQQKQLQN